MLSQKFIFSSARQGKEAMMKGVYQIELTQLESPYLSDALSMFSHAPPDDIGSGAPYPNLLLKIGGAVLETDKRKAPANVCLSIEELWMVRETAKSSAVVGSERVGLSLLLKVYEGLRSLAAETDMAGLMDEIGQTREDEPGKADYAAKLAQLRDDQNPHLNGDGHEEGRNDFSSEHNKPNDTDENRSDDDAKTAS